MPAKNVVKDYSAEGYCHVYNRGVNKRRIFIDNQDYKTFLSYLKIYLCPQNADDLKNILGNLRSLMTLVTRCISITVHNTETLSSYPNYLNEIHHEWVRPSGFNSYKSFVEGDDDDTESLA